MDENVFRYNVLPYLIGEEYGFKTMQIKLKRKFMDISVYKETLRRCDRSAIKDDDECFYYRPNSDGIITRQNEVYKGINDPYLLMKKILSRRVLCIAFYLGEKPVYYNIEYEKIDNKIGKPYYYLNGDHTGERNNTKMIKSLIKGEYDMIDEYVEEIKKAYSSIKKYRDRIRNYNSSFQLQFYNSDKEYESDDIKLDILISLC